MKKTMRSIFTMALLVSVVFSAWAAFVGESAAASAGEPAGKIAWQSYDTGISMARDQGKKIFLYFHANWCTYCKQMEASTFTEAAIIDYLNDNYIAITVDSDKEKRIASRFGVRGLPTSWFLKSDTGKLSSLPGYIESDRLLTILKFIHTESYKKMSYQDFKRKL